jgi:hypothetical protein
MKSPAYFFAWESWGDNRATITISPSATAKTDLFEDGFVGFIDLLLKLVKVFLQGITRGNEHFHILLNIITPELAQQKIFFHGLERSHFARAADQADEAVAPFRLEDQSHCATASSASCIITSDQAVFLDFAI